MTSNLEWLQHFYLSLCNGDWEHGYGCKIDNVDNPGWSFEFEFNDTVYQDLTGPDLSLGADQTGEGPDWVVLKKDGPKIKGACGPLKLETLIGEFRAWVEKVEPQARHIQKQWHAAPIMKVDNDLD